MGITAINLAELPDEVRTMIEQIFHLEDDTTYKNEKVQQLSAIQYGNGFQLQDSNVTAWLEKFGFDEKEMAHCVINWGKIMAQVILDDKATTIDLARLATMAYLGGVMHGVALERGCDGEHCANCEHHA